MPEAHKAQLHLCHERIEGHKVAGGHTHAVRPFCDLKPWAWCYGCDFYVCDIHAVAMHDGHDLVVEFPANAPSPGTKIFRPKR